MAVWRESVAVSLLFSCVERGILGGVAMWGPVLCFRLVLSFFCVKSGAWSLLVAMRSGDVEVAVFPGRWAYVCKRFPKGVFETMLFQNDAGEMRRLVVLSFSA